MNKPSRKAFLSTAHRVTDATMSTLGGTITVVLRVVLTAVLVLLCTGMLFACIFAYYVKTCLSTDLNITLEDYMISLSSVVYTANMDNMGNVTPLRALAVLDSNEDRIWVEYEDIPKDMEHAAVAIEDKRFYDHKGVDWYRTAGAFVNMFIGMKNDFGGSTITQQLIKNVTENDDVTVQRKLAEIFQAMDLEKAYTKEEIMMWYLNVVYFGEGSYGIHMAAQTYFGKDVSELDLCECASIIAITNNPSRYDPFISSENNRARRLDILYEMYDQGYISYERYRNAAAEEPHFVRSENDNYRQEIYPYYVEVVIDDVLNDLVGKKGLSMDAAQHLLYHGGYKIYCCMDEEAQGIVDSIYQDVANLPKPYRETAKQLQSAVILMDPYTGDILALCGGTGMKNESFGWNRATDAHRPAGSAIKPLAVYGPAFDLGLITQDTLVNDTGGITLSGTSWYPRNYGGGYNGVITIRQGLIMSLNTVAAQIMDKLTPAVSYEYLTERMGFNLVTADCDYAPLSLGQFTNGVTVREMAQAYTSLVNDGTMTKGRSYYLVTDENDNIVLDNRVSETSQVFKTNTARHITNMLQGVMTGGTGVEAQLGAQVAAGKTGTTSDEYDRWFCGFTPYYVCVVWTGYDMPSFMYYYGNPAAQVWKRIMQPMHASLPVKYFTEPTYWGVPTNIFGDLKIPEPEEETLYTDPFFDNPFPTGDFGFIF